MTHSSQFQSSTLSGSVARPNIYTYEQGQRSLKLTPREPKGNKTRDFKVKTSTQKLKSQHVSSAKQSEN